jgi:ketosteroid isomerase-like protein
VRRLALGLVWLIGCAAARPRGGNMDDGWNDFVQRTRDATVAFVHGDAQPYKALWSHADDVSIMGGFGGHEEGWTAVGARLDWAASHYGVGWTVEEETLVAVVGDGIAMRVSLEHNRRRAADGSEEVRERRVTHVARRERDGWRIVHHHSDPLLARDRR